MFRLCLHCFSLSRSHIGCHWTRRPILHFLSGEHTRSHVQSPEQSRICQSNEGDAFVGPHKDVAGLLMAGGALATMEVSSSKNSGRSTLVRANFSILTFVLGSFLSVSCLAAAAAAQSPTDPSEIVALGNIKTIERFTEQGDPCNDTWQGIDITCDGGVPFQHILAVNLSGSTGIMAPDLFSNIVNLPFLRSLLLSGCSLTGTIPGSLSSLPSLRTLDLSNNSLQGKIPTEFGNFLFLQNLSLAQNQLEGQVPEELCEAKSLKLLKLGGNALGGPIPPCLGKLSNISVLSISSNNLSGSIPESLGELQALTELDLGNNSLTGPLPASLTALSNLRKLHLSGNLLEGALPVEFQHMTNLRELYLDSNHFSGPIPDSICHVQTLQKLRLFDNQLNGSIPKDIGNLTQLTVLFLHVNQLSGPLPMSMGNLTLLQQLQLQGNRLNGSLSGSMLAGLTNLQSIYVHFNELEGEIPMSTLSLSKLQNLSFGFNNFNGSIPDPRATDGAYPPLGYLRLVSFCNNSLSGPIPIDMGKLGGLRYLDVSNNQLNGSIPSNLLTAYTSDSVDANLIFNNWDAYSWSTVPGSDPCLQMVNSSSNEGCQTAGSFRSLAINVGGEPLTSVGTGVKFVGDNVFESGLGFYESSPNTSSDSSSRGGSSASWLLSLQGVVDNPFIHSTAPPPPGSPPPAAIDWNLFQTARLGGDALSYKIWSLKPGNYFVDLFFAELDPTVRLGQRLFSVYIQGELKHSSLDIFERAGGTMKPTILRLPAFTSNGMIEVRLVGRGSWPATEEKMMVYRGPILSGLNIHHIHKSSHRILVIASVVGSVLGLAALLGALWASCVAYIRKRKRNKMVSYTLNHVGLMSFKLADLEAATNKFNEKNLLGQGGFGRVYKGVLPNGAIIAIKQLSIPNRSSLESLQNELQVISTVRHRNLVSLIGCCFEMECPMIVCQYMPNGNLHDALFNDSPVILSWSSRCKIALDVASGLHYLHEGSVHKIVHRDVKPSNILLDSMLSAHIADFGLARLLEEQESEVITTVMGTRGYMAPEYVLHGQLSDKVDVFSFGVVLLELVIGRRGMQTDLTSSDKIPLCLWARQMFAAGNFEEMVDKRIGKDYVLDEFMTMLTVAIWCTESQSLRPSMVQVLHMLTGKVPIPPLQLQRKGYPEEMSDQSRPFDRPSWESLTYSHSNQGQTPSRDQSGSMSWEYTSSDYGHPDHSYIPGR